MPPQQSVGAVHTPTKNLASDRGDYNDEAYFKPETTAATTTTKY